MAYNIKTLFWECTLRCNMECRHCGSDCTKTAGSIDMPLADFIPVLDEIKMHQPKRSCMVHTIGGEPLVREDLAQCGREITRKGFYWGMVTNAMLLDEPIMKELSRNGLNSLAIDIDGLPAQHNWLRRSQVSFDRAYNAIQYVRRAPHLSWDVITCVTPAVLSTIHELKRMLIDAGVKHWRCFTIIPMGRARLDNELQLDSNQLRQLMDFIVTTRREGNIGLSYACEGYLGEYECKVRRAPFMCVAGLNTASVRANGDISGCLSIRSSYNQGNIYRDSFWDVWTNRFQLYRDRRWMRRDQCIDCEVSNRCKGSGIHLRNADGSLMVCHYKKLYNHER